MVQSDARHLGKEGLAVSTKPWNPEHLFGSRNDIDVGEAQPYAGVVAMCTLALGFLGVVSFGRGDAEKKNQRS